MESVSSRLVTIPGKTYCIGDFYFIDPLKGKPVKEDQLPRALFSLHRRPCQKKLVVWAKAAVGPAKRIHIHVLTVHVLPLKTQTLNCNCKTSNIISHGKVVGQSSSFIHRLPEIPYVPNLQSVITWITLYTRK